MKLSQNRDGNIFGVRVSSIWSRLRETMTFFSARDGRSALEKVASLTVQVFAHYQAISNHTGSTYLLSLDTEY